jgi:protein-S-isoprenylcysteine O-methyltransferase Ste14
MPRLDRSLFADVKDELGGLTADVREMFQLRGELARLELENDRRAVVILAVGLVVAAVLCLVAAPLFAVAVADWLARAALSPPVWLCIIGGGMLLLATAIGLAAWFYFRRVFTGLAESRAELLEDLHWLREWAERKEGKS